MIGHVIPHGPDYLDEDTNSAFKFVQISWI